MPESFEDFVNGYRSKILQSYNLVKITRVTVLSFLTGIPHFTITLLLLFSLLYASPLVNLSYILCVSLSNSFPQVDN